MAMSAIFDWILGVAVALRMSSCFNLCGPRGLDNLDSIDGKRSEREISGSLCSNGAANATSVFSMKGKKGINQDAMIVWEDFGSAEDTIFCGVFDGHGPSGHMVARKVRNFLPAKLRALWHGNTLGDAFSKRSPLKESLLKAYKAMDKELRFCRGIDCLCSGTTAVTLIKTGREITTANLGDSRAILGTRGTDEDPKLVAIPLTTDHKPKLQREARRIRKHNGRIFASKREPDVARVWLPNIDAPGLAMSRSFGDHCLKKFGLVSVPEISHRHLTENDEFIILASDGIWDVLSNQEAVDVIASSPSRASSARLLVEYALGAWQKKYGPAKLDDISVVCLYLNADSSDSSFTSTTHASSRNSC